MLLLMIMTETLQLHTSRSIIRVLQPSDAALLRDFVQRNRQHLAAWEGERDENYYTLAACEQRLHAMQSNIERGIVLPLAFFSPNKEEMLGTVALSNIVRGFFQACYLGYSLDGAQQGRGLMFEVLQEVIRYAFDEMALHRLMANYVPQNQRSAKLLGRLGFTQEGYAKDYLKIAGRWQDHVLTALTNPRPI